MDPQTDSTFMKVARAVDGDDHYTERVVIAFELAGKEMSRKDLIFVTKQVADSITCTESGTVVTSGVTDTQIVEAMELLPAENTEPTL